MLYLVMSCFAPLLDPVTVARILGVEVETLGAWRRKGYGPPWYRIGKKIKYSAAELDVWMKAQMNAGTAPPASCMASSRLLEEVGADGGKL
jgi:hypothetical protein